MPNSQNSAGEYGSTLNRTGALKQNSGLCDQYGGESESGLAAIGSPENWRCIVFEKLREVELPDGSWKTAPNHFRPATCIIDADIDAEDQPECGAQRDHAIVTIRCRL
jgi:hypothetical protein